MNSISENTAQKWLTKLWPVLLRELTLAECKGVEIDGDSIQFIDKNNIRLTFRITEKK